MSINKVFYSGNLAKDVEVKTSGDGQWHFGKGSIAVKNRVKGKDGTWGDQTLWVNYKIITKYSDRLDRLVKGEVLMITGSTMVEEYTAKDGTPKKFEYVQVDEFEVIKKAERFADRGEAAPQPVAGGDDEIPF